MYHREVYMESFYPDGVPVQYRCDRIFCCKKAGKARRRLLAYRRFA